MSMEFSTLAILSKKAAADLYHHPLIVVPIFLILFVMSVLSYITSFITPFLRTNTANIIALIILSTIVLIFMAFFFSFFIGLCQSVIERKKIKIKQGFEAAKGTVKNFVLMLLIIAIVQLITWTAFAIGRLFAPYGIAYASFTVVGVMFLGFISTVIFLTFATFYAVIRKSSIMQSIQESVILVKQHYTAVLLVTIVFFALLSGIERFIPLYLAELIKAILITPYFGLLLVRFLLFTEPS